MLGSVESYDMSQHIGPTVEKTIINFDRDDMPFPDCFIEIEWTITDSTGDKEENNRKSMAIKTSENGKYNLTPAQIKELIETKEALASQLEDVQTNLEHYTKSKQTAEISHKKLSS